MFQSGTRAPSMKTSLNIARPVISRSGRISTPGWSISNPKYEMPVCFGDSGSVRAISMPEVADLRGGGPHLLPGDDPLVAVALGLALQAGEVRARAGLAEQLAPRVLTVRGCAAARGPSARRVPCVDDRRRREQVAEAGRRADRARPSRAPRSRRSRARGCSPARSPPRGTSARRSRSAMSRSHHSATVRSGSQFSASQARTSSRTDLGGDDCHAGLLSGSGQELEDQLRGPRDDRALVPGRHDGALHELGVLERGARRPRRASCSRPRRARAP